MNEPKCPKCGRPLSFELGTYYCHWCRLIIDPSVLEKTVDVVEVVHGRWEEWWPGISLIMTGEEMLYMCSSCDAKYADIEGYKYCPNCGAKMMKP